MQGSREKRLREEEKGEESASCAGLIGAGWNIQKK